jgi:hypothetical protein
MRQSKFGLPEANRARPIINCKTEIQKLGALAVIAASLHLKAAAVILTRTSAFMPMLIRSVSTRAILTSLIRNRRHCCVINPNPTFFQRALPASPTTVGNGAVP